MRLESTVSAPLDSQCRLKASGEGTVRDETHQHEASTMLLFSRIVSPGPLAASRGY